MLVEAPLAIPGLLELILHRMPGRGLGEQRELGAAAKIDVADRNAAGLHVVGEAEARDVRAIRGLVRVIDERHRAIRAGLADGPRASRHRIRRRD